MEFTHDMQLLHHRPNTTQTTHLATAATILQNLLMTPQVTSHDVLHCTISQTQHKQHTRQQPQRFCGIYPRYPQIAAAPSAKHDTNNIHSWQQLQQFCGIYPHTHKVTLHHRPKQHKQKLATTTTIVQNLPTHPQVTLHHCPKYNNTNKSRQWLQPLYRIYPHTHSHTAWSAQTQTQTKNNPATAAMIMQNFCTVDTKSQ